MQAYADPELTEFSDAPTQRFHTDFAVSAVDRILSSERPVRGRNLDLVLDLRGALARGEEAEQILESFLVVRRILGEQYELPVNALQRWLEAHLIACVNLHPHLPERTVQVKINRNCLEAIKCGCILSAHRPGEKVAGAHVKLDFV